ncbi:MAG: hypothetical protein ACK4YX_03230 [Rhabdaerophilum calidifontis]
MTTIARKSAFAAAALAAAFALMPVGEAEARHGRKGALAAGIVGGALIAGALAAPRYYGPAYAAPVYSAPAYGGPVYVEEPTCYIVRERVWDDYSGRWVRVRRQVCD